MNKEESIKETKSNISLVNGLQMYGFEITQFLKLIELNEKEEYVGIDEIESLVLMSVLSFEKVLKTVIIALDNDITEDKLIKIGHNPDTLIKHILKIIEKNDELFNKVSELFSNSNFNLFLDIINEMSSIKRRYDKMDVALGRSEPKVSIIDDKVDLIDPDYRNAQSKTDKKILLFLKKNTLELIYILQIILGEIRGGSFQQSLVSLFPQKYRLNVLAFASIERKFFLLNEKRGSWSWQIINIKTLNVIYRENMRYNYYEVVFI